MRFIILSILFFISFSSFAQSTGDFSKIKIDLRGKNISDLALLGIEVDHGELILDRHLINVYSKQELQLISEAGFEYKFLIKDLKEFFHDHGSDNHRIESINRSAECGSGSNVSVYDYVTPENYVYGSMEGYLTYNEAMRELDRMTELYPDLITERMAIGDIVTHGGNQLHYMIISDNPNVQESEEPQALYTALHHAREPNALSQLIFYMWYLLENYESDEEVKYLVDNTAMYFLPIINVDGYKYNEETDPEGGGFWRKNRYPNAVGDSVGVDLNRNYDFFWAYDDFGSSPNEQGQTYRGPSAASEPETKAIEKLCEDNFFQICQNYHTSGNLLIHPWGYLDTPTEEDDKFKSMAGIMTAENFFTIGTGTETVGYTVNGDSDDYMYGEETKKNKIYAMTPEVGPSFWPGEDAIDQLNKSCVRLNLNTAHLLLNFGWAIELFPEPSITSDAGTLFFEFEKSGLRSGEISFSVVSDTPGLSFSNNEYPDLQMLVAEKQEFSVDYELVPSMITEDLKFHLLIDNGEFGLKIPMTKNYIAGLEEPDLTILDPIESEANYITTGSWGITDEDFISAPYAMTDSPNGDYEDGIATTLIISEPLVLDKAEAAILKFYTKFDIEDDFDFVQLQATRDGSAYEPLCGLYTDPAVPNQLSDLSPVYDGLQTNWVQEQVDLNDFLGEEIVFLRFIFESDNFVNGDGFYFDDLVIDLYGDDVSSTQELNPFIIAITPNPTADQVTVRVEAKNLHKKLNYIITDITGMTVATGKIDRPEKMVDLIDLQNGTYFFQVIQEERTIGSYKLIKAN